MQRIQRKVGRFMPNRTPNEADIDAMLRDFNDSDQMLLQVRASHCCLSVHPLTYCTAA